MNFITKKHLSRRTILRGAGTALALPFLDAMVPAGTALAQTVATPKPRFVGCSPVRRLGPSIGGAAIPGVKKPAEPLTGGSEVAYP